MFTAEQAALALVNLVKEHFPDNALSRAHAFSDLQDEATSREAIEADETFILGIQDWEQHANKRSASDCSTHLGDDFNIMCCCNK